MDYLKAFHGRNYIEQLHSFVKINRSPLRKCGFERKETSVSTLRASVSEFRKELIPMSFFGGADSFLPAPKFVFCIFGFFFFF
jgi:hypothetical protein